MRMLFLNEKFSVDILSVLLLDWQSNQVEVPPRPYDAISFRIKGSAEFSDGKTTLFARDNDILFMPAGVRYHITSQYEKLIVIHFDLEGKKQNNFEVISPDNIEVLKELFLSIYNTWIKKKTGYELKTLSIFYRILEKIFIMQTVNAFGNNYEKIKPAVRYLNEHYTENGLTVEMLAEITNMSDTYFRKLFYKEFGKTPNKYINSLKISYAIELLNSGYYSVEQIAEKSGFCDAKYFSKTFKFCTGFSPSQYQKK